MKYKTTKKEIKNNYNNILNVGYCDLQYLLNTTEAESYCAGVYGWNCDNYKINGTKKTLLISTGYNPINDKNISGNILNNKNYILKKYEIQAQDIIEKTKSYDERKNKLNALLTSFVDEILESEKQDDAE